MSYLFDNFFSADPDRSHPGCGLRLVALGYTMVYGVLQLINFAHSEVFMYGTFAALWAVMLLGGRSGAGVGSVVLWVLAMLAAAMIMSGAIALAARTVRLPTTDQTQRPTPDRADLRHRRLVRAGRDHGPAGQVREFVGLEDKLNNYVSRARDNAALPEIITPKPAVQHRRLRGHQRRPPRAHRRGSS